MPSRRARLWLIALWVLAGMGVSPAGASARAPVIAYVDLTTHKVQLYDAQTASAVVAPNLTVKAPLYPFAVSFDGRYIAYLSASDGKIHLYDRGVSAEVPLPGINIYSSPDNLSVSDNGLIAFDNAASGGAVVYSSATGSFVTTGLPTINNGHRQPELSAGGLFLATTCITGGTDCVNNTINSGHSTLFVQNLTTRADTGLPLLNGAGKDEEHPCIDANGGGGLVGADVNDTHRDVFVFSHSTSADLSLPFLNTAGADTIHCALSPAGDYVGVANNSGVLRVYDVATASAITVPATITAPFVWLTAPYVPPAAPTILAPANGATFTQSQVVNASYSCQDFTGGLGIGSCAGPVASGSPIATGTPGTYSFTVTATEVNGLMAPTTNTYTVFAPPPKAPVVSSVAQTARAWLEGALLPHISSKPKPPVGTTFSFDLSAAAHVTFTFTRRVVGRRSGKKCVAPTRRNQHQHRCPRTLTAGTLSFAAQAGAARVRFEGRLTKHKKLALGRYTLVITAKAPDGLTSVPRSLHFTIV
jgi:hypothetical protein